LNQALLNVIVNAAHAIGDVVRATDRKGRISVRSRCDANWVTISIADTGTGIAPEIRDRIFDPFFTTKEVGMGSGQGLAIARSAICERHGGELSFDTELGKGTTFVLRVPVCG
jgi:two-component system, NtrC family, sensor kinase